MTIRYNSGLQSDRVTSPRPIMKATSLSIMSAIWLTFSLRFLFRFSI